MNTGVLERLWQGIYCLGEPSDELRLRGLELSAGARLAVCLGAATAMYGFDTEPPDRRVIRNLSEVATPPIGGCRPGPPPTTMSF